MCCSKLIKTFDLFPACICVCERVPVCALRMLRRTCAYTHVEKYRPTGVCGVLSVFSTLSY